TFAVHDVLVWLAGTNGQLVASSSMPVLVKGTDYGTVGLTTAVTNNFRVGNETGSAIGMTWTTNGTGSAAFRVVSFAGNIAAGGISNLLIRFAPPSAGVYTTAVAFASAGLGPDPFVLYLSATGAPAATLGFDSAGLNFATDYGNDPAGQTLVITNNGSVQAAYTAAVSRLFVPLGSPTLNWLSISPTLGAIDGHGSTAISVQASAYGLDVGVYHGTVTVYSVQATNSPQAIPVTLTITQALATVSLADLYQVYDGNAKPVMAWTTPSGKNVDLTYDGLAYAPTNPGSYAVTGVVNELNYYGSNVDRLRISLNDGIVNLGNLVQIYDGTPRIATYTTEPTNLTVDVTYDGSPTPPTNAGLYAVEGAINDPIYQGSSTGTLTVYQKHQWIAFQNPGQQETPSRFGLYATASSGLTVLFNVLSGPGVISGLTNLTFTDTGTVNIVASQPGDRNWYAAPAVGYLINVDTNRAPTIEIIIPTTNANYNSDTNLLTFGGTAADNVAVASVTLRNSRDVAAYTCTGTTNWQFTGFPLYQGSNYVTAVAYDLVGNSSTDAVAVAFTNDTRYDDVLRSGGMIQEIIFPDNLTTGATVKVQWKILSYVPVVCRVYAGDLAATWSFFKSGIFTGVTQSPWNLFGRHANIYSFECDWTVPQKPGEFRVWFNAAQMDGDQYMIPVIPDGVDARPDLVHPKLIQRTILPGGSVVSGNPPSDPDIWNPADIFETREQQLERAGASITYINLASNLIVGASVTSEWKVLSYVDINSQVILLDAVPTNIWLVADATLVGSPQITTYRFKNRQDGTMWYYAYEYTFRTTFVVPDVPGMQQLYFRCKRSDNPASAPMAASISAGVDPEPWLFNSMYGRFIERLVVDPGP
ncbi:MAG: MBG domain-containing protein, partial [bacterium]